MGWGEAWEIGWGGIGRGEAGWGGVGRWGGNGAGAGADGLMACLHGGRGPACGVGGGALQTRMWGAPSKSPPC